MKRSQSTKLLFLLSLVLGAAWFQVSAQDVSQLFKNPPKAYRPMVRWWWPGGDVTDAELRREVNLLDQANFGGAEIQPFRIGLNPNMPEETRKRVNDYLTPTFFSHMQAALVEARSRGMWLDYTFGSGWPFGGAGVITPELASVELRYAHQTIHGPGHFHEKIQVPEPSPSTTEKNTSLPQGWVERFQKREKLVAVVAVRGDKVQFYPSQGVNRLAQVKRTGQLDPGTSVVLTSHLLPDGTLDWNVPSGTWQVFVFKQMPTGQRVTGGVGSGLQLVLDHMNRQAFATYADRVGGTARQYDGQFFGHGLRAIFCDSLEVSAYLYWSDDFLQEFRKLRGYDLTPYLPILKVQGLGMHDGQGYVGGFPPYDIRGIGDRVRRDYWQTVSDVMIENFYTPFIQWAANNDLLSRVQAHGSPTDLLRVYGASSIPETEDLYDNGRYDFLKMASSGADLYGRKIVSSESFVWMGGAYQTTPEKIKRYADELITAGINEIIYHGYPYEYMDRPEPGWHPFAIGGAFSSDMNQHNTFWPYLPQLNRYITRLQYISQTGSSVVPVALYRGTLAYDSLDPTRPEPGIDTRLMAAGYNFDHIDGYVILHSKVADGKLISPGGEQYRVLILPHQKSVSAAVSEKLTAFASQGLPIVFIGPTPVTEQKVVDGKLPSGPAPAPLEKITAKNVHAAADAVDAVKILQAEVRPNLHFEGLSVPFIEKRIGAMDIFFLRNSTDAEKRIDVDFPATGTPEIWDPWTGERNTFTQLEHHGNTVQAHLDFGPYGSKLLVFSPTERQGTRPTPERVFTSIAAPIAVGQRGWKLHAVGIGPGSQPETVDMELPNLVDWTLADRLKNFSGRGVYTTSFTLPTSFFDRHRHIFLDLGSVKDVAEISIDGKPGPTLLMLPYKADVTGLIHVGENTLQVTVVNALFNALAANGPSANYSPEPTHNSNGRLPSGLIGPVQFVPMIEKQATKSSPGNPM